MATYIQPRRNGSFIASEASGSRSREVVTLKVGSAYPAGALVVAEKDAEGNATGFHVLLTSALVASKPAAVVLIAAEDATAEAVRSAVIARDAEVKAGLIEAGEGVTDQQKADALGLNGIIVRASF